VHLKAACARFTQFVPISRLVVSAIIVVLVVLISNCSGVFISLINATSYLGPFTRHADLRYGEDSRQTLDIYVPTGASGRPVVVFWYGGFWHWGSKDQYRYVGAALANAGYLAVLPDYRIAPQTRFPGFVNDGALAVKWTRENVRDLGGDPRAIFLMGHSAGGHIAATLALDERYLSEIGGSSGWVRGWIALSSPYELQWFLPWVYEVFDGAPAERWRPIELVSSGAPPALLIHALEDVTIHPREAANMHAKLSAAGVHVKCLIYPDAGHAATVLAFSPLLRWESGALADVQDFIDRTFAASPPTSTSCPGLRTRRSWDRPYPQPYLLHVP
jgi:acetyl esterase/lipase